MVSVEVACSTTELARDRHLLEQFDLLAETIDEHHNLLAKACRRSRLAVSAGEHRDVLPLLSIVGKQIYELLHGREIDLVDTFLDRHRNAGIVDILAGEAEMDEFLVLVESETVELVLDEIFNGLDIVIGYLLDILDLLCLGWSEVLINSTEL